MDGILIGPSQSGLGSNGNEKVTPELEPHQIQFQSHIQDTSVVGGSYSFARNAVGVF